MQIFITNYIASEATNPAKCKFQQKTQK